MTDRRANAAIFGYDFQIKAAIVIMLDNIKDASALKIEGAEDIEIRLSDGKSILAQAKAIMDPTDTSNVRAKLKLALESLSDGALRVDAKQLILVTNSTNPFNDEKVNGLFWGANRYGFHSLPESSRNLINNYLSTFKCPLNPELFFVQRVPFNNADDEEQARAVIERIRDFLGSISITTPGLESKLYDVWSNQLYRNGASKDEIVDVKKEKFIWPIIVFETDVSLIDEEVFSEFDEAEYDEITRQYHSVIDSHCERYSFVTRVLYDYSEFSFAGARTKKMWAFVNEYWGNYKDEFFVPNITEETLEGLTKIVLYSVVRRRIAIDKIREGANL